MILFIKRINIQLSVSFLLFYSVFNEHLRDLNDLSGGDDGIRTHDPLLAGQVLSQLSYTPILLNEFRFSPFFDPLKKRESGRPKWTRTTDLVLIRHAL